MPRSVMGMRIFWPAATCASTSIGLASALVSAFASCTAKVIVAEAALPRLSRTVYVTG